MQIKEDTLSESLRIISQELQLNDRISQSKAKQLFLKLTSSIFNSKCNQHSSIRICLKIILEIQLKTYNFSCKNIPQVWKVIINLQLRLLINQGEVYKDSQEQAQNWTNLHDFYTVIISSKFSQKLQKGNQCSLQDIELILKVWNKSFFFSDTKTLQYAVISLHLYQTLLNNYESQTIQKIIGQVMICTEKVLLNLMKFSEKIKQSQTFESLVTLIENMEIQFYKKFEKQIENGIKTLNQASKLTEVINHTNIHFNVWEKMLVVKFVCLSKKLNDPKDVQTIMTTLNILKKTLFFEKLINLNAHGCKISSFSSTIISGTQLQHIMFGTLLDVWINLQIRHQISIEIASEVEQKVFQSSMTNYKAQVLQLFKVLTKRELSILMVRQLVKRLQIVKLSYVIPQWKQLFIIMHLLLKSYPKTQNLVQFTQEKSYISKSFSPTLKFPFTVQLKVKGESIPFKEEKILIQFSDSNVKEKVWITMRNYQKHLMIFSFVKLLKNNIFGKEQRQFKWNQYDTNKIQIVLKSNKIKLLINNDEGNVLSMENSLGKVDQIVLCDRQSGMGSTISQLFHFKIIQYNIFGEYQKKQVDLVPFIDPRCSIKDPIKQNLKFHRCQRAQQNSFIYFVQTLGDLQLFMLLLYHTLKKIKNEDNLLQVIRMVLNLLEQFTLYKEVQNKQLSQEEKNSRRNSILCLSWFFSKQTKSVFIIFQLMRFLYIRGKRNNLQLLKFLCNFTYWKDFKLDKQILIVMKIKEILKESSREEQKINNLTFCKKLIFDMVLYFKESHYLLADKQTCLKLHRFILQTVYGQLNDIIEISNKKTKNYMLEIFSFVQFIISLISCILNRKIHEEAIDITFAIELTLFLRDIAKLLFVSKQRKYITKADIDLALETYFKKQEKQLIVPLSLNAQQICDERFNLYLVKIMSLSKSLIILFDTETFYFEQSQIQIYPINTQSPIFCNQTKVHTNVINFEIYMSMLSQKSWNYILYSMPISEYTQRFCQNIWRICFYELFKQKKYFPRMCKMLEQTPLPQNEYCLMKIFEVVLFYSIFDKDYLFRILKSQNFVKSICPFKIQQILIKYLNKLEPQICNTNLEAEIQINKEKEKQVISNFQQQKIYYVLLYSPNTDFDSCKDVIDSLRYRKSYDHYKVILYQVVLKSLVKFSQQRIKQRKQQQQSLVQSSILPNHPKAQFKNASCIQQNVESDYEASSIQSEIFSRNKEVQSVQVPSLIKQKTYSELILLGIEALQFYLKSLTHNSIKQFFKVESNEDIEALKQNFVINVQGMIKALKTCQKHHSSHQFQKYLSFIEVYLKNFSMHLIKTKFPSFKSQNYGDDQTIEQNTKKGRNKFLYKTVHIDLIKKSSQFFVDQITERRTQLHSLQQMWNEIEKKNKYLWNLFISPNKYYSLSDITTQFGQRLLLSISNERPKIQLPKMINKYSLMGSVSLISTEKIDPCDQSELSTIFDECELLKTQLEENEYKNKEKVRKGSNSMPAKQIKTKKFRVLIITNDKIHQGLLFMTQKDCIRFEETYPSQKLYDKIGATAQERRDDDQIEKDPRCFDIILGSDSKIFFRKYLYFDAGIEIFCHQKVNFLCFDSDQKRNKFCSLYLRDHKVFTYQKIKKAISQESTKWSKGLISNYDYLMKVNQYANRSPNDLSQYYVMPWTIIEFQKKQIDKAYIFQFQNFRDLRKPLGRAFQTKWKEIETRFKMSFGHPKSMIQGGCGIQPFLYGSFYSNPAIVTNYMIRLQPFSSLHYLLQSQKIDVADRLFFQFSDQLRSIKTNVSDIKELIPQFYNNPQFLKNRSRLNLGSRQNKQIVNDVRLPKWADSAYEFVFKMKYFLECPLISKYLNHWIDLTFGFSAKKQNALAADNLYMCEIYGPKQVVDKQKKTDEKKQNSRQQFSQSKNSSILQLENRILFNKEFGQLPFTIFDDKHPQFDMVEEYYFFKGIVQTLFVFSYCIKEPKAQISLLQNFCVISSPKRFQLIDTNSADFNQKQNFKLVSQVDLEHHVITPKLVSGLKLSSLQPYLFYVKKTSRKICSRFIKKAKIFGSLELKDEYQVCDGQAFNWIDDEVFVVACNNTIKVYSFEECSINHSQGKVYLLKIQESKPAVSAKEFPIFTQHQAEICFVETNNDLKLIVSLDEMNKVFILKYYPDKIQLINNFTIKNCHFEQKIIKVIVHKMSLIICLTNYHRLLTFNFYGDLIGSKQIGFKTENKQNLQKVNCLTLFNKQTCEILMGTNLGNIWKVDLFEFYKTEDEICAKDLWFQKISLNSKDSMHQISDLKVKRYGRHWQIYVISLDQHKKKIISKIKCLTMKNISFNLYK